MVTSRQENEIQKLMKRIKDAKESNDKRLVEERTAELYQYLESEGLVRKYE